MPYLHVDCSFAIRRPLAVRRLIKFCESAAMKGDIEGWIGDENADPSRYSGVVRISAPCPHGNNGVNIHTSFGAPAVDTRFYKVTIPVIATTSGLLNRFEGEVLMAAQIVAGKNRPEWRLKGGFRLAPGECATCHRKLLLGSASQIVESGSSVYRGLRSKGRGLRQGGIGGIKRLRKGQKTR